MSSSWWMLIRSRLPDPVGGFILPGPERYTSKPTSAAVCGFIMQLQVCTDGLQLSFIKEKRLWNSLTLRSKFFRLWLSLWVLVSAFGVPSTCWKVMVTTTPAPMLMYGREAQSKTRIASPATIPKSGERNRKIHSCMLYLISI
jgi:hypothetical protein